MGNEKQLNLGAGGGRKGGKVKMKEMDTIRDETTMAQILKTAKDETGLKDTKDIGKNLAIGGMVVAAIGGALMMVGKILMEDN
ncbi:MAG: hypothetical protein ABIM88_00390 [candidate division WOR-3 bacterium]